MTTSKKSSSKLTSLKNFDPENEDFGSEIGNLLSRNKKGASLQHGHLGDMKISASAFIGEGFKDKKYSGKTVSRKELTSDTSEDISELSEDDDFSQDSENSEMDSDMSDISEMSNEYYSDESDDGSEAAFDSDESDSMSDTEIKIDKMDSKLSAQMRELDMDDDQAFELISKARPADDNQKSQHVRNQLVKFDDYVDLRFKLQPLLNSANRFPDQSKLRNVRKQNVQIQESLDCVVGELDELMKDLLYLSSIELTGDGIEIPKDLNPKKSSSKMQNYWDEITRLDSALDPFAKASLQQWHNKMTLSSDLKAKKTLRMLNQDPYQQVQIALQDEERLVARTRVYRDGSKKRIGCEEAREYSDIYDDNDFYQVLLKDWTASHGALSSSTAAAMSAILVSTSKKQHRENVDQRASKGRKIRYDVHAKLINYMVPQIEKGAWTDSKIDEFYASLLGQGFKN